MGNAVKHFLLAVLALATAMLALVKIVASAKTASCSLFLFTVVQNASQRCLMEKDNVSRQKSNKDPYQPVLARPSTGSGWFG